MIFYRFRMIFILAVLVWVYNFIPANVYSIISSNDETPIPRWFRCIKFNTEIHALPYESSNIRYIIHNDPRVEIYKPDGGLSQWVEVYSFEGSLTGYVKLEDIKETCSLERRIFNGTKR